MVFVILYVFGLYWCLLSSIIKLLGRPHSLTVSGKRVLRVRPQECETGPVRCLSVGELYWHWSGRPKAEECEIAERATDIPYENIHNIESDRRGGWALCMIQLSNCQFIANSKLSVGLLGKVLLFKKNIRPRSNKHTSPLTLSVSSLFYLPLSSHSLPLSSANFSSSFISTKL